MPGAPWKALAQFQGEANGKWPGNPWGPLYWGLSYPVLQAAVHRSCLSKELSWLGRSCWNAVGCCPCITKTHMHFQARGATAYKDDAKAAIERVKTLPMTEEEFSNFKYSWEPQRLASPVAAGASRAQHSSPALLGPSVPSCCRPWRGSPGGSRPGACQMQRQHGQRARHSGIQALRQSRAHSTLLRQHVGSSLVSAGRSRSFSI